MDKEDSDFECYGESDGRPVHVDADKEVTKETRHLHYYRSGKTKITIMVIRGTGMRILVYAGLISYLSHRNFLVVCHIYEFKITFNPFAVPTQKEPPKLRGMTLHEIDSVYDPNENN